MYDFIDKTDTTRGTPLNREAMLAIQGFIACSTVFNNDGTVTETNSKGQTKTTTFSSDGSITEVFKGEKTITKITTVDRDGNTKEVII